MNAKCSRGSRHLPPSPSKVWPPPKPFLHISAAGFGVGKIRRGQTSNPINARASAPHNACPVLQEGVTAVQVLMSFPSYPTAGERVWGEQVPNTQGTRLKVMLGVCNLAGEQTLFDHWRKSIYETQQHFHQRKTPCGSWTQRASLVCAAECLPWSSSCPNTKAAPGCSRLGTAASLPLHYPTWHRSQRTLLDKVTPSLCKHFGRQGEAESSF